MFGGGLGVFKLTNMDVQGKSACGVLRPVLWAGIADPKLNLRPDGFWFRVARCSDFFGQSQELQ